MEPGATPQGFTALTFAGALVAGEYDAAYGMLSSSLQAMTSAMQLQAEFESMVDYFDGPPDHVVISFTMDEWPDKHPADVGWAYAAILNANETHHEAVTVVVAHEQGKNVIREIIWGRP